MRLWLDVEDLFAYAAHHARPTGVQRLSCEIAAALLRDHAGRVGFLRHDPGAEGYRTVAPDAVMALYARMATAPAAVAAEAAPDPPAARRARLGWLPREIRQPLGRAARAQAAVLREGAQALRALPALWQGGADPRLGDALAAVARPGDVLAAFGSPWSAPGQPARMARAAAAAGARIAVLVHDLIPLQRPEFCDRAQIVAFAAHLRAALPAADVVFANSHATAAAIEGWAVREGLGLRGAPAVLPVGLTALPPPAALPAGLRDGAFVLMVGTIEARKNHWLAFRAWRRLLEAMPAGSVPPLVFAGREGWMVADLLQALRNSAWLDGAVRWVREPDDATLAALYRGCRFTLFPSHIEGWGLPVVESLAAGRPCVATCHGAIAEASAGFAEPIDPDDVTGATATLRRLIEEPAHLAALAARIEAGFRAPSWSATADAIMARLMPGS
jgi:glycosyltransferase involved in cell wall biosynthesis